MPHFEAGQELPELKVTPDRYLTVRYAGASGDFNPIHVDEELAKAVGLPGKILHGLWSMAQVARCATQAGGGPASLKALEVQFRGMGVPEAEVVVSATVTEVAEGRAHLALEAVQDGTRIVRKGKAEVETG